MARWLPDGNVEFLGRIDHQVKIRGFRIELGEIENRLLEHESVKEAVVLDISKEQGETYLCAYVVAKSAEHVGTNLEFARESGSHEIDADALRQFLSHTLPDYMVPALFVFLDNIPLNPNGKIDRKALPEPEVQAAGAYVAPRDDLEKRLTIIWSEVLGIEEEKTGIEDNFFELGGHSLKAVQLVNKIHKEFAVELELKEVFNYMTIHGLAQRIKDSEGKEYIEIASSEKKEYYSLSYGRRRLWVLNQLAVESSAFKR